MNVANLKPIILILSVLLLSGCFQEELENFVNRETLSFNGLYDNPHNKDVLEFRQGVVYMHSAQQNGSAHLALMAKHYGSRSVITPKKNVMIWS